MVRTRTFDPSTALNAAVDLFMLKGYAETSMDDLVNATGVSRYGLYGTFGNKRELFEQALDRYAEGMGKQLYLRLLDEDATLADIRHVFESRVNEMSKTNFDKGCLFVHTAMQLANQDEDLKGILKKYMDRMSYTFAAGLETAKARGEVRENVDTKAAAAMLTNTIFGFAVLGRTGFSREALLSIASTTIDSLTP
jgi:TetR/AcrR family transcriptional repressor of nem operon